MQIALFSNAYSLYSCDGIGYFVRTLTEKAFGAYYRACFLEDNSEQNHPSVIPMNVDFVSLSDDVELALDLKANEWDDALNYFPNAILSLLKYDVDNYKFPYGHLTNG